MRKRRSYIVVTVCFILMLLLILDSKTALSGASEALRLCIKTVVPSLFPMMVLSSLVTNQISANASHAPAVFNKILGIPRGSEGILAPAFIGGYPVGAACIATQYRGGHLSRRDAEHLLSFCSNAGPSFIFGICAHLFVESYIVWLLWLIHIVSALMVGVIQSHQTTYTSTGKAPTRTMSEIVKTSAVNMAVICSWIILFRVLIQICEKWLFWLFPDITRVILSGVLELTNGCFMLEQIPAEATRFLLCSVFLSLGGLCVLMQTTAVIAPLSPIPYFRGKILQALFSLLLSGLICIAQYSNTQTYIKLFIISFVLVIPPFMLYYIKKSIAFLREMRYNTMELFRKR